MALPTADHLVKKCRIPADNWFPEDSDAAAHTQSGARSSLIPATRDNEYRTS
ncbi:hypothetical protein D3C78_1582090 [compost metagenome]